MPDIATTAATTGATSGLNSSLSAVATGAQIGAQVTSLIAGLSTQKNQQKAQAAYLALTAQQQAELNQKIANASSHNAQLQIITDALVNSKTSANTAASKSYLVPVLVGLGVIMVMGTIMLISKKKSAANP